MVGNGSIYYKQGLDNSQLKKDAQETTHIFDKIGKDGEQAGGKIDNAFKNAGKAMAAFFTIQQAQAFTSQLIKVRGEFQQLEIAFNTMLGSAEAGQAMMAQAVETAAKTPFDLTQVAQGYKQLLAYGIGVDEVNESLTMLGDVASAVSAPLGDIVYLYGTLNASGRVTLMDIRQFAGRGIPIYEELAKVLGTTKDKVNEFASDGKIAFEDVRKAFQNLTGEGGKFNNLMEKQSKSLTGQMSNLKDKIDMMFNEIGKSSEGALNSGIELVAKLVKNYEEIGKVVATLVVTYGAYKAAIITTTAVNQIAMASKVGLTTAETAHYVALVLSEKAQKLLNATMLKNPYVLAATLIIGIVTSLVLFKQRADEAQASLKKFNSELANEKAQLDSLFSAYNSANEGTAKKKELHDAIVSQYGEYISDLIDEQGRITDIAEAQERANTALKNNMVLKKMDELNTTAKAKYEEKLLKEQSDMLKKLTEKGVNSVVAGQMIRDVTDIYANGGVDVNKSTRLAKQALGEYYDDVKGNVRDLAKAQNNLNAELNNTKQAYEALIKPTNVLDEFVFTFKKNNKTSTPTDNSRNSNKTENVWEKEIQDVENYAERQEIILLTMQKRGLINQEAYEVMSQQILLNSINSKIKILKKYNQNTNSLEIQALKIGVDQKDLKGKIPQPKLTPFEVAPIDKEELNKGLRLYLDYVQGKEKAEKEYNEWLDEQIEKKHANLVDYVYATADIINSVTDVVDSFGGDTRQLDNVTKLVGGVATAGQGVAKIMSGDIVGGITDTVRGLADIIVSINAISDTERQKEIEKMQEKVEGLQDAYDNLGDKIEKAYSKDASKMIEQQNVMLKQQQILIKQQIEQEKAKKKTDEAKVKEWEKTYEDLNKQIEDNKEKAVDVIFGEDIQSAIEGFADAYVSAWEAGEDKAKSSKDFVNNMIKKMIAEAMNSDLTGFMEKLRNQLVSFLSDDYVSDYEQSILDQMAEEANAILDSKYKWADKYYGKDKTQGGASYGAYQNITESQANSIDGRLTGIHMETVKQSTSLSQMSVHLLEMRDAAISGWGELISIRKNTALIADTNTKLDKLILNTSTL